MFNRSGLIALAIAGAIVAWGAFYKDDPEPRPAPSAQQKRRHDGEARADHSGRDGGLGPLTSATHATHAADGGSSFGGFDRAR